MENSNYNDFEYVSVVVLQEELTVILLNDLFFPCFEVSHDLFQPVLEFLGVHILSVLETELTGLPRGRVASQLIKSLFLFLNEFELETFEFVFLLL